MENWTDTIRSFRPRPGRESEIYHELKDRYQFIKHIGDGSISSVYAVVNRSLNRMEALKVLSDDITRKRDFIDRFKVEATISASFVHPNIVPVYKYKNIKNIYCITMFFIGGPTLSKYLNPPDRMSSHRICDTIAKVCDAVHYAHLRGVIHRDLKTSNILLDKAGIPYVTDFGSAKWGKPLTQNQTGSIMESPNYVSPEQAAGLEIDHRADIYALGVTLYALLTQQFPDTGESPHFTIAGGISQAPNAAKANRLDLAPQLRKIIEKALREDRQDRYQTAAELATDLNDMVQSLTSSAVTEKSMTQAVRKTPSNPKPSGDYCDEFTFGEGATGEEDTIILPAAQSSADPETSGAFRDELIFEKIVTEEEDTIALPARQSLADQKPSWSYYNKIIFGKRDSAEEDSLSMPVPQSLADPETSGVFRNNFILGKSDTAEEDSLVMPAQQSSAGQKPAEAFRNSFIFGKSDTTEEDSVAMPVQQSTADRKPVGTYIKDFAKLVVVLTLVVTASLTYFWSIKHSSKNDKLFMIAKGHLVSSLKHLGGSFGKRKITGNVNLFSFITAPDTVHAGGLINVEWVGPAGSYDAIQIYNPGTNGEEGKVVFDKSLTSGDIENQEIILQAPGKAGNYQLRYWNYSNNAVLSTHELAVTDGKEAIAATGSVHAGELVSVHREGEAGYGDALQIDTNSADR